MPGIAEPPKRILPGFATRVKLCGLGVLVIGGSGAYLLIQYRDTNPTTFYGGFALLGLGLILGILYEIYVFRRVRCPQCERPKLPRWKPNDAHRSPYHYYCGKCHVVWVTGLFHVDPDEARKDLDEL